MKDITKDQAEDMRFVSNNEVAACLYFDECKNPLKDEHCDELMRGEIYCFVGQTDY